MTDPMAAAALSKRASDAAAFPPISVMMPSRYTQWARAVTGVGWDEAPEWARDLIVQAEATARRFGGDWQAAFNSVVIDEDAWRRDCDEDLDRLQARAEAEDPDNWYEGWDDWGDTVDEDEDEGIPPLP
jgi:hypothetical protein